VSIFKTFEGFAEFGEGMLETVVRVVDTNTKINQQIKNNITKNIPNITEQSKVTLRTNLVLPKNVRARSGLMRRLLPVPFKKILVNKKPSVSWAR
jgi:hypothetical protein